MKFDRNTVIGFVVLAALFFGYFFYNNQEQSAYRKEKAKQDSIALAKQPKIDPQVQKADSARADSIDKVQKGGQFRDATNGTEQIVYVQNEVFTIALTTKGGQPKWVELKKFKNMDSGHVRLAASPHNGISYALNTENGTTAQSNDFYFSKIDSVQNADGSKTVSFTLSPDSSSASSIIHRITIRPNEYMV